MRLAACRKLVDDLLKEHHCRAGFKFHAEPLPLGYCLLGGISLSKPFVLMNPLPIVREIILHEIAHILTPESVDHDKYWWKVARRIGCREYFQGSGLIPFLSPEFRRLAEPADSGGHGNDDNDTIGACTYST